MTGSDEVPREQVVDPVVGMAGRDGFEGGLEPGVGLDPVQLRGLGERGDPAPGGRAFVVACEQRVFPRQSNRPGETLDSIAVHLDAAVGEEEPEAVPVAGELGELLTEAGLGRDAGALLFQPVAEGLDQRRGPCLSFGETALGRAGADLGLDGVELGDPAQALGCDLRAAAVVDFAEPAPRMGPTVCQPYRRAALAAPAGQPVVTGLAVDLQDAVEAVEEALGIFAAAPGGIEVHHARRIGSAPGAVIAGQRP